MSPAPSPSGYLSTELSDTLRAGASEAERRGALLKDQLDIIYRRQWFNLFVPQRFGGLEMDLPGALRLQEALAWTDGSLGWTITLCSGAAWFIGFLEPAAAREIFSNPEACLAGSGQPSGIAEVMEDSYRVTGRWHYATGATHATVFTANCILHQNGATMQDADGQPIIRSFWFHYDEVQVHPDWHVMGMIATASHSFSVNGITVPRNRCFIIDGAKAVLPDPVFQYPFLPFAEATLAVNIAGMAVRFLDLCRPAPALANAKERLGQERASFFETVDESWKVLLHDHSLSPQAAAAVGLASRRLASLSLRLVDELFPLCGLEGADTRTEINRVWRNLHTASQHVLLRPGT